MHNQYMSRGSVPYCSAEVSARLQLHSPPFFRMPNTSSRVSGVGDSCKIISRSRRAILGTLDHNKEEYGNLLKKKKPLPHANSLNRTTGKRIPHQIRHKASKNTFNFSEVFQDSDTDISMRLRNVGQNVDQTMDSRNAQYVFSQTSDELIHKHIGTKTSYKSPQSSCIKALKNLLAMVNKDRKGQVYQGGVKQRLETEEQPSIELTQEASFIFRQPGENDKAVNMSNNGMKEKFEETTKYPIQNLLRPINRCYKQTNIANRPYVIKRVCMKANNSIKVKKEDKCVCF